MINNQLIEAESSTMMSSDGHVSGNAITAAAADYIGLSNGSSFTSSDRNNSSPSSRNFYSETEYKGQGDPLVYILAVLSFYIVSITVLLLKYVRTQRQEEMDTYYYNAFVKREGLHLSPPTPPGREGARMTTVDMPGTSGESGKKSNKKQTTSV